MTTVHNAVSNKNFTELDQTIPLKQPQALTSRQIYQNLAADLQTLTASYLPTTSLALAPTLHFAAFSGALDKLERIQSPSLFETKDAKGMTPLHYALAAKQKDTIRYLLDKTDLTYLTPDANSYLHFAALSADPEILELFLKHNIDPVHRNNNQLSAAHLWAIVAEDPEGLEQLSFPGTKEEEPLPFTPFELMALKQADADTLLSDSEWELFSMNLADLAVVGLSTLLAAYKIDNFFATMVSWAHTGITLAKTGPITKLAASSPKLAENTNAQEFLMYRGLGLLTSTQPLCSFVQSSTATIAVAKHTLTSVPKMKNASWKNILTASGVRLLNTACALLDTHLLVNPLEEFLTIRFPRSIGELEESLNTRFQWTLNGMTPIERMNDPVLTKGLGEAGENVIKYPENYALLADPKNPTTNCRDFNPHYKKLSLLFHPDKNPNNPKAAEVMTNLKLLKAFYCKKV